MVLVYLDVVKAVDAATVLVLVMDGLSCKISLAIVETIVDTNVDEASEVSSVTLIVDVDM